MTGSRSSSRLLVCSAVTLVFVCRLAPCPPWLGLLDPGMPPQCRSFTLPTPTPAKPPTTEYPVAEYLAGYHSRLRLILLLLFIIQLDSSLIISRIFPCLVLYYKVNGRQPSRQQPPDSRPSALAVHALEVHAIFGGIATTGRESLLDGRLVVPNWQLL